MTMFKRRSALFIAATGVLALGAFATTASAQIREGEHALLTSPGGATVMSGFGICVHSGFGPAPAWTEGCHQPLPASAGAKVAVAVVPAMIWENVAFDANVLFDSDKSALRPLGRDKLDQFVDKIHGLDSQNILAVGYADRMGTSADNQELSQQRVDAVKAYLVARGIAADRVQTRARGETRPSTYASECKDANNPKNVACMQPDRHVFIEVSGTRSAK